MTRKGREDDFDNCSTGSECRYGSKLVISAVDIFWHKVAQCAKLIPFSSLVLFI